MNVKYVLVEGSPPDFLDTVRDDINSEIRNQNAFYLGAIESVSSGGGGAGPGPHATDNLGFHLREGIAPDDAKTIINLALDRIAERHDMKAERKAARLTYEDDEGRDREL